MVHPTLLKAQCVVQRVHSTSPHHMIKSGSDLNPTAVNNTVVLLLVMSFTTQVGPTNTIIMSLLNRGWQCDRTFDKTLENFKPEIMQFTYTCTMQPFNFTFT